jgi:hypothetical protein
MNLTWTFGTDLLAADLIISLIPRSQWKSRSLNAISDPGVAYAAINFNLIYPTGVTIISKRVNAGFQLLLSQCVPLASGFYVFYFSPIGRASSSPGLPLYITPPKYQHVAFTWRDHMANGCRELWTQLRAGWCPARMLR